MSHMHWGGWWTPSSVEIEWFSLLVVIQDRVHVSVREKYTSLQQMMSLTTGNFFKSFYQHIVNCRAPKLFWMIFKELDWHDLSTRDERLQTSKFFVVDPFFRRTHHIPRIDKVLFICGLLCGFCCQIHGLQCFTQLVTHVHAPGVTTRNLISSKVQYVDVDPSWHQRWS